MIRCDWSHGVWRVPLLPDRPVSFAALSGPVTYEPVKFIAYVAHQFRGDPGKRIFAILEAADGTPIATVPVVISTGQSIDVLVYLPEGEHPTQHHADALAEAYWEPIGTDRLLSA